jgi:hypothetical protein
MPRYVAAEELPHRSIYTIRTGASGNLPSPQAFPMRCDMSGRQRLPGGAPRKASQRHSRRAAPSQARIGRVWRSGDPVRWRDRAGTFARDLGDGEHAEIVVADRTYRVRIGDLA